MFRPETKYKFYKNILSHLMLGGMTVKVIHAHRFPPKGPVILVCNHRSALDALIVSSLIDRYIRWVVADYNLEVFWNKWLFNATDMIPIGVSGTVMRESLIEMDKTLQQQQVLGIFPEGQDYILKGEYQQQMAGFYHGFAHLALKHQVNVVPCVIKPLREKLIPMYIPKSLRLKIELDHGIKLPRKQVKYQDAEVRVGEPLDPPHYRTQTKQWLTTHVREKMMQAYRN